MFEKTAVAALVIGLTVATAKSQTLSKGNLTGKVTTAGATAAANASATVEVTSIGV